MNGYRKIITSLVVLMFFKNFSDAQTLERKTIDWQNKLIYLGPVLAEDGVSKIEFIGKNPHQDSLFITDVITDCGCTAVEFSKDTMAMDQMVRLIVSYQPDYKGGEFSKIILVRTNLDIYGDTLILEGINFPVIDEPKKEFPYRFGPIGFRLPVINLGQILTNEPKVRFFDVYNFGKDSISFSDFADQSWPSYIEFTLEPLVLEPQQRGLLSITFDAEKYSDLGYFKKDLALSLVNNSEKVVFPLTGTVFEFFEPVPKSMEKVVPKLQISETDIDFKEIVSTKTIQKTIQLANQGMEPLLIRKISTSCECVSTSLEGMEILPDKKIELSINFNPKGRKGIDHKHITLFTNDPVTPVRTITLRSMIK